MVTICNIVCCFTAVKMWMLNFKFSRGQNQSPAHHLTIVWVGNWFWSREYLKFSIHIFTTVKQQTILQIVKLESVLSGVGHCFVWHVWVSLDSYLNFKTEALVHSGLCAMHLGHTSIFPSSSIKIIILWQKINKCYTFG